MKGKAKTVRYTDEESAEIGAYAKSRREQEARMLERVSMRGLREERMDEALAAYVTRGLSAEEASAIAGLPKAVFIRAAAERNLALSPDSMLSDLARVSEQLGDKRLKSAVQKVSGRRLVEAG